MLRFWLLMLRYHHSGLVLLLCWALCGCAVSAAAVGPSATPTPPLGAVGPDLYPPDVNPLTGLPVDDPALLERRPIIVKVSNSPPLVRPQAGIGQADLVFEHYTEAGITRFSALFYTHAPERVGSIRSARLIDYELVPMYQGILAFSGASIGVDKRIYGNAAVAQQLCRGHADYAQCEQDVAAAGPVGDTPPSEFATRAYRGVLYGPPYYWRDDSISVPHNMFVNVARLWELAAASGENERPDLRGMAFHPQPQPEHAGPALALDVRYRTTLANWVYDAESRRYLRFTDGQPHFDANTGQQVSADNVVVLYAGHYLTDIIESQWQDTIHWSVQITVWPEGEAIVLRDGLRYNLRWLRPGRAELISFVMEDGSPFYLRPGSTWFQLVPLPEQMDTAAEWVRVE